MARRSPLSLLNASMLLTASLLSLVSALQVTPNSPCSDFCIDSLSLDTSDPNSSTTNSSDIVCLDTDFSQQATGQKFQQCLSCLQDSEFHQGDENDQDWFLYNLRYAFDYCVFAYPNASNVGSNPCMTSEACGPLTEALEGGLLDLSNRTQFGYCETDNKAMLSQNLVEQCRSCVQADESHNYVANFLVALEAGCEQKPAVGTLIGLNETVFSDTTVEITSPSTSSSAESGSKLPNTSIAAIVISVGVFLLFSAGCVFMQCRKRKNRNKLSRRRIRASSLSFWCQTRLSRRQSGFRNIDEGVSAFEKQYTGTGAGMTSNRASYWNPKSAMHNLTNITTNSVPQPSNIYSPNVISPDDYTTPMSAVSTRSNAPLLYGKTAASPQVSSPDTSRDKRFEAGLQWEEQPVAGSRDIMRKKGTWGVVAPVETQNVQTSFPPPPKREF